jgi:ATP-dependent DNA helicase RecQ
MNKHEALKRYFGYDTFRNGQEDLIDAILNGIDVLGIMPTGAGKSVCYQIPALLLPGITLVISPLISLMKDQVQALNQAGIHAAYINSSLTETQISKALQLAAKGQYKIIYVAPERLETYNFMQFVTQVDISMLTVDEAHCISQWGQDFRPSYLKIVQFIKSLPKRPIVSAFTATATERVKEDIMCVLGLITPKILVTGFDRENLYFGVETPLKKDEYVIDYIKAHATDSGIIYCATRKNVDKLHEKLLSCGIPVTKYHAGLTPTERQENQEAFIYDKSPVMVATNAFGMGIDKSNVRYVIHYNMPQSLENYYQEAGRAGRDGEASECILLYSSQDVVINRFLLDNKEPNPELDADENEAVRQRDEERLQSMINYCMTPNCLKYILNYFGEYGKGDCGNCSSCLNEYEEWDITEITHKIIACVDELKGRYGINVVAGTLSGNDRAKLREYKVSTYTTYATLKELSEAQIKQVIQYLMIENILDVTKDKYALLHTTAKAREVLTQATPIIMKKLKTITTTAATTKTTHSNRKSDILNSRGLELFETLRSLRTVIAREESIPPYLVFSDKTLVDMCIKAPLNKEEMLNVSGVGNNKYDRYGERFINEINIFTNGHKEKMHFGEAHEAQTFTSRQQSEKINKADFYLTKEQAQNFPYADKYLVTEMAVHLSALRDESKVKKLTGADIFRKMQAEEYATEQYIDGMRRKVVFEKGKSAGLFIAPRTSHKGTEYEDIYYNESAQRMIVEMYIKD